MNTEQLTTKAYGIWQVIDGADISDDVIHEWIAKVNTEYGRADKNTISFEWLARIKSVCLFMMSPFGYAVLYVGADMWGNRELDILSYYIEPQVNRSVEFRRLQKAFEEIARELNCRYLVQGSHLEPKLYRVLGSMGYEPCSMKMEIKRWE